MGFVNKKISYITISEMNKHLEYCYKYKKIVQGKKPKNETFGIRAYVEDKLVYFYLSYKKGTKACTYICRKDGTEKLHMVSGMEAYRTLQKYYKTPNLRDDETYRRQLHFSEEKNSFLLSAKPLLFNNPNFEMKENLNCISYDLNSSYSYAMLKEMPDTSVKPKQGTVGYKEIGFREDGDGNFIPVYKGHYSQWIFPLMPSPFKKFVEVWYAKKKNAKTEEDKVKAKETLNESVGYLQRTNPFLRATIIYWANEHIKQYIDENTIYCNTDSIVSLKERKELQIGEDIGQFKIEHQGRFVFKGFNYQWNFDKPSYRHISKEWFPEGYDFLKDPIPCNANIVHYKNYKLEEISYESFKKEK